MPTTKPKNQRQLKVYKKYFGRAFFQYKIFPEISLSGKWLKEIGFECRKIVTVNYRKGKIIIKLE